MVQMFEVVVMVAAIVGALWIVAALSAGAESAAVVGAAVLVLLVGALFVVWAVADHG